MIWLWGFNWWIRYIKKIWVIWWTWYLIYLNDLIIHSFPHRYQVLMCQWQSYAKIFYCCHLLAGSWSLYLSSLCQAKKSGEQVARWREKGWGRSKYYHRYDFDSVLFLGCTPTSTTSGLKNTLVHPGAAELADEREGEGQTTTGMASTQ